MIATTDPMPLTVDQVRALIEVDSSLRVFILENPEGDVDSHVIRTVRRDLIRLRGAFPSITWPHIDWH